MITITIEETDKHGRVLSRHSATAAADRSDAKELARAIALAVGGLMYDGEVQAEAPLLLAAAGTHRSSSCVQALGHAVSLAAGRYSFDLAVKPLIDVDRLLDYRASKRDREEARRTLRILGAQVRRPEDDD